MASTFKLGTKLVCISHSMFEQRSWSGNWNNEVIFGNDSNDDNDGLGKREIILGMSWDSRR